MQWTGIHIRLGYLFTLLETLCLHQTQINPFEMRDVSTLRSSDTDVLFRLYVAGTRAPCSLVLGRGGARISGHSRQIATNHRPATATAAPSTYRHTAPSIRCKVAPTKTSHPAPTTRAEHQPHQPPPHPKIDQAAPRRRRPASVPPLACRLPAPRRGARAAHALLALRAP